MFLRQWQRRHETQIRRLKDCKARPKIATWNCRGLTVDTITPTGELKLKCLINRMQIQHWGCIVLTDTKGPDSIRECSYHGRQWTIVHRGRVAFLLEDIWTTWWQSGGSRISSTSPRVAGFQLPRQGWRRGLFITGVYASTSDSSVEDRQTLRDQVNQISEMATATSISIIAGDF